MSFIKFIASRLTSFFLVVMIGVTIVFFVPRLVPGNPVEAMLGRMQSMGTYMEPEMIASMRATMMETFGLTGTLWEQYTGFLRRAIFSFDFGVSLSLYPARVNDLIGRALPWSISLLLFTTLFCWFAGNAIGLLAGFYQDKLFSKVIETLAMIIYPVPYYILALLFVIVFAYIWPIFPFVFQVSGIPWSWPWIKSVLYNSFLPATSIILVGLGWWIISMKALVIDVKEEDYVQYATFRGVKKTKVMLRYVARTAILPQITTLGLQLGGVFGGSLITEMLFGYPGIGTLIYKSILGSDYNTLMGAVSISILAVATTTLAMDLIYPFIDPRIRYK